MKPPVITTTGALSEADKAAVLYTLNQMGDAWMAHDMDRWTSFMTEDVEWVNVVGQWWRGKPEVLRAHKFLHAGPFRNFSGHLISLEIAEIAPGVVLATSLGWHGELTTPSGKPYPAGENRTTEVLLKQPGGRWLIRSGNNVNLLPEAANFDASKMPMGKP